MKNISLEITRIYNSNGKWQQTVYVIIVQQKNTIVIYFFHVNIKKCKNYIKHL